MWESIKGPPTHLRTVQQVREAVGLVLGLPARPEVVCQRLHAHPVAIGAIPVGERGGWDPNA